MVCWKCGAAQAGNAEFCVSCRFHGTPTPLRIGRFVVSGFLGNGTFGNVFRCVDTLIDRTVAVKLLMNIRSAGAVLTEARAVGKMDHPNIVQVYDVDDELGMVVMEYMAGGNLAARLESDAGWVRKNFTKLFVAICEGLRAAHLEQLVHRDIKPGNILLTLDGTPKLADFGLARILQEGEFANTVAGSPAYMAPEVLWGEPYGASVDIHSLGCVMYEAWSGRVPFRQPGGVNAIALQKRGAVFRPLREVDPKVDDVLNEVVNGMLAPIDQRIQSIEIVIEQLKQREPVTRSYLNQSLDDFQYRVGAIYGLRNRARSPLLLMGHYQAAMSGIIGGLTHPDEDYGARRAEAYFPRAFAWLCAVASSLNLRLSQLIWLKFDGQCPYCRSGECACNWADRQPDPERNQQLVAHIANKRLADADPSKTFGQYQAMFRRIYGKKNRHDGILRVAKQAYAEHAGAVDALLSLRSLEELREVHILHLELSDLVAWFFALLNFHNKDFSFVSSFEKLFGRGCYACKSASCVCPGVEHELRLASWREF